jgi:hypothetical protein
MPNLRRALPTAAQRRQLDLIQAMDRRLAAVPGAPDEVDSVIQSFELAFQMQDRVPALLDLSQEPKQVLDMYGVKPGPEGSFARQCLMARRLCEAGVRFVEITQTGWDHHNNLHKGLIKQSQIVDQPTAALLTDLKQRGLLEDTLVLWTTEFGRMPTHQEGTTGRDHNPDGFTCWLMGAGVKGGVSHGATDEFGRRAAVDPTTVWDFYATVLHLLGFDHERLTVYHNGLDRRLTDVHGAVINAVLA